MCQFYSEQKDSILDFIKVWINDESSSSSCYIGWLLYEGGFITWGIILKIICDAVDLHVSNMLFSRSKTRCFRQFDWFLWKHLAIILGKIKGTPRLDRPVLATSDLYEYAGDYQADPICSISCSNATQFFIQQREWWGSTLFNPNSLGNFVWGLLLEEIQSRLRRLELYPYETASDLGKCGVVSSPSINVEDAISESFILPVSDETREAVWTELQTVLVKGCFASEHFRSLTQDIEDDSDFDTRKEIFYPLSVITAMAAGAEKRSEGVTTPFLRLGAKQLEILTYQIIVCCHLRTQDSLFVIRAVQLLCMHRSKRADICIGFLMRQGVNVERAIVFANRMCSTGGEMCKLFKK